MPVRSAPPWARIRHVARHGALRRDKYSLSRRVARFLTEHAWTEDPPSRLRHHLSNVRTLATVDGDHLVVDSATLLFRNRGDIHPGSLVSAVGRTSCA